MGRIAFLLILALCVIAQAPRPLPAIFSALSDGAGTKSAVARELSIRMYAAFGKDQPATRAAIDRLAHSLADALWEQHFEKTSGEELARALTQLVTPSSQPNAALVRRARIALSRIGIDALRAESLSRQMIAVGEQVRGPDDMPVLPPRRN